jgi:hypothetical protein
MLKRYSSSFIVLKVQESAVINLTFVINLIGLIASFALAHFLGRKLRGLVPKGKEFISLICSLGILTIFYLANDNLFSLDKHSLLNAIYFGVACGLAFGIR